MELLLLLLLHIRGEEKSGKREHLRRILSTTSV